MAGGNGDELRDDVVLRLIAVARTFLEEPELKRARSTIAGPVTCQGWASRMTLAVETEQRFGIRLTAAEMEHVGSIRELLALMKGRLPARLR